MKNILISAIVVAMAFLSSCSKEESVDAQGVKYKVNFAIANHSDFDTRAVKSGWANGDEILIIFKNDENQWFNISNGANTLKLTYNGSSWVADDTNMPTSGFKDGAQFAAFHHPGDVSLGTMNGSGWVPFKTYKGGEQLKFVGNYSIVGSEINLGIIALQRRDASDFQISVKGLIGDGWKLSICADKSYSEAGINIIHYQEDNLYINTSTGHFASYANYIEADGIEYGGDVSFCFSKVNLTATTLVFILTNGTDEYFYTKTGVTSETLEYGKAYYLPAITDPKWETE